MRLFLIAVIIEFASVLGALIGVLSGIFAFALFAFCMPGRILARLMGKR